MPGFVASVFNPATSKTETSDVDDLDAAKIRARTLRGMVEFEQQAACVVTVTEPRGRVWVMSPGTPPTWKRKAKVKGKKNA